MSAVTAGLRQAFAGLRVLIGLTLVLGLLYPLVVTGVSQVAFPARADGSVLRADGREVGSTLLGQSFTGRTWFHPRPSAAGDGYDPNASSASNLGPTSAKLRGLVAARRAAVARENRVPPAAVPPDAVTASASGLDPDISPAYAALQVQRVATARGLTAAAVRRLVAAHTTGRTLGFLGEPRVNVLTLNAALAALR